MVAITAGKYEFSILEHAGSHEEHCDIKWGIASFVKLCVCIPNCMVAFNEAGYLTNVIQIKSILFYTHIWRMLRFLRNVK